MTINIVKPTPADPTTAGTWGATLNAALDVIVAAVNGNSDAVTAVNGALAAKADAAATTTALAGKVGTGDARLTDTRTPTDGTVTTAKIASGGLAQTAIAGLVAALASKATPADISTAIGNLTAGSPAELDTFLEAYNRFLTDETALSNLTTLVAGKYTKPGTGIPATDLAQAVQDALTAAGNALSASAAAATYVPDLSDVTVSAAGPLTAGKNSNLTAAGTYTAPAPAGSVGTVPQRFAVTNATTGAVTVSFPRSSDGATVSLTVLAGEVVGFRQKTTLGYSAEFGNKPLSQLDSRFGVAAGAQVLATPGLTHFDKLQPICNHVSAPGGATQFSDGTQTTVTYSAGHVVLDDATSLSVTWPNWAPSSSGEAANPNPITITASAVLPDASIVQMTWRGATSVTVAPGADAPLTDALYVELTAGQVIYIRTCVTVGTSGQTWPWGTSTASPNGLLDANCGQVNGSDATMTANPTWTSPGGAALGPHLILGRYKQPRRPLVAIIGASTGFGWNDQDSSLGYAERACVAQKVAFVKTNKPAEPGATFLSSLGLRRRRMRMVAGCTHAILSYGSNDIATGSATFAGVAGMLVANAKNLAAVGVTRIYVPTLQPRSTSTDNFATVAGQTVSTITNLETVRQAVNAWIRAGFPVDANGSPVTAGTANATPSPLFTGGIELADVVETGRNTGIWTPLYASDGTHPNAAAHRQIANVVPLFKLDTADTAGPGVQTYAAPSTVTGLQAWYDPTSLGAGGLNDGTAVATWNDQSSNGFTATQATSGNRPVYRTQGINYVPAVQFAGSQWLTSNLPASGAAFTCILVAAPSGTGSRDVLGGNAANARVIRVQGATAGTSQLVIVNEGSGVLATQTSATREYTLILTVTYNGGNAIGIRVNGVDQAVTAGATTALGTALTTLIGGEGAGTNTFIGYLGDIAQYSRVLTPTEIAGVEAYEAAKYGVNLAGKFAA